jgi:hypothetical protein
MATTVGEKHLSQQFQFCHGDSTGLKDDGAPPFSCGKIVTPIAAARSLRDP